MAQQNRRPQQAGFTLVELLIVMTVTLIGLTGLVSLYRYGASGNVDSERTSQASVIGQRTMEDLRGLSVAQIGVSAGGYPVSDNPLTFLSALPDNTRGVAFTRCLDAQALAVDNDLVRMRVTVLWNDDKSAVACDGTADHRLVFEMVRNRTDTL